MHIFLPVCGLSLYSSYNSVFYKAEILTKSNIPIFPFTDYVSDVSKTHLQIQGHLDFLLCYLLEVFFSFAFTFMSLIYLELNFLKGMSVRTHCFTWGWPLAPADLLQRLFFLSWIAFAPLSEISWLSLCASIPGLYSVPEIYLFILLLIHHFDYCSFMVILVVE